MGWATWQEQWVQMSALSGLSHPRQPGGDGCLLPGCLCADLPSLTPHPGTGRGATRPASASSRCWALGITGASEPQHPHLQRERMTSPAFGGCQACFHSSPITQIAPGHHRPCAGLHARRPLLGPCPPGPWTRGQTHSSDSSEVRKGEFKKQRRECWLLTTRVKKQPQRVNPEINPAGQGISWNVQPRLGRVKGMSF